MNTATAPLHSALTSDGQATAGGATSWGAIFGGAAAAAALSLILLLLGAGLGFSSISPWTQRGVDSTTFGVGTIVWITFMSIVASGAGGYIAGRLRSRWVGTHGDEVYFRDTVHGFLAWSVATLVTATLVASAVGSVVSTAASVGGTVAGTTAGGAVSAGAAAAARSTDSTSSGGAGYFVDSLFRKAAPDAATPSTTTSSGDTSASGGTGAQSMATETGRIFAQSLQAGTMSPDDTRYVGQLVAQRTGLSQADAEKRVTDTFGRAQAAINDAATKAKDAADKARKASAYAALWLFVSLLIGAFMASLAATYGGRRRDLY